MSAIAKAVAKVVAKADAGACLDEDPTEGAGIVRWGTMSLRGVLRPWQPVEVSE